MEVVAEHGRQADHALQRVQVRLGVRVLQARNEAVEDLQGTHTEEEEEEDRPRWISCVYL